MPYWLQSPNEVRDIAFDWTDRLDDLGSPQDTISSSTWTVSPDVGSPSPWLDQQTVDGVCTFALLRDITVGDVFVITNTISTGQGRTHSRTATVRGGIK